MRKIIFILIFLFIFAESSAIADTLYLKNGAIFKGKVVEETKNGVMFKTSEGSVFWHNSEIERIEQRGVKPKKRPSGSYLQEKQPPSQSRFEDFTMLSPESARHLTYATPRPPFQITAPSGWYMFLRKETSPDPVMAVFCKHNPYEKLPRGVAYNPYIEVILLPNTMSMTSTNQFALSIIKALSKYKTLVPLEEIRRNNRIGSHFALKRRHFFKKTLVIDNTIFLSKNENIFICIRGYNLYSGYKVFKKEIEESINSIKFSIF